MANRTDREMLHAIIEIIEAHNLNFPHLVKDIRARLAEKQEAVGFNEWFENLYHSEAHRDCTRLAWLAAQQALRDQIKEMLRQSDEWFEEDQQAQAKWLLEKIDDSTL